MSKEEPAWRAELRREIRGIVAEENGFNLEWLEPSDYQSEASKILLLLEPHIRAAEQRGFQAGVNKTGDSVGKLRAELRTARDDERASTLREVLTAICDEDQRRAAAYSHNRGSGLGWEAARDIVQSMLRTAECERCKGSGIDPEHSHPAEGPSYYSMGEPEALEPCIACQSPDEL